MCWLVISPSKLSPYPETEVKPCPLISFQHGTDNTCTLIHYVMASLHLKLNVMCGIGNLVRAIGFICVKISIEGISLNVMISGEIITMETVCLRLDRTTWEGPVVEPDITFWPMTPKQHYLFFTRIFYLFECPRYEQVGKLN